MNRTLVATAFSIAFVSAAASLDAQTAAANPQRPIRSVESVRPQQKVRDDARRIDELLARSLAREQLAPAPIVDDATFLRRTYLSILGRIPTLAETETFLGDASADKRHILVDRLLDSPGRTSHFTNFWFDLLRVKSRQRQLSGEPFAHFVRESVQKDKPYDVFVREMLVAEGAAHAEGSGATGYLLRDMNMPHDAMANTLRLFLGTRLECAQCHNHPFDVWTQKEFFAMAAFFGGLRYRDDGLAENLTGMRAELAKADERTRQQAQQLLRRMSQGISGKGTGVEALPRDYKYDDAKPGTRVAADTLFGQDVKLDYPKLTQSETKRNRARNQRPPEADSRAALADWLTSRKNPMFTKVIAGRMWARTFGAPLTESVDDWKKDTRPRHPELFLFLEKLMVEVDYDLRQFERVLAHTQLFQRESQPAADDGSPATFRGPLLRRMSAEQMWDSLLTLVFADIDERLRPLDANAREVYAQQQQLAKANAAEILALADRGNPMAMQAQAQRQQEVREQLAADAELQKRARPLLQQLAQARREGDQQRVIAIAQELERMGLPLGQRAGRGREGDMLRASDLPQPANPSHLLRQFGQSDRETIDASSTDATVPQVLTLLNGFLDQRVLQGQSALRADLETAENGERRVRIAFLTTLNRPPDDDELLTWRKAIAVHGENAIRDLAWVLCNSNEFRFVQ